MNAIDAITNIINADTHTMDKFDIEMALIGAQSSIGLLRGIFTGRESLCLDASQISGIIQILAGLDDTIDGLLDSPAA
jgi:hypothetical protein